ncbi:MAG: hypothetical protein Q9183_005683, partial [Haloplaca sp. 2 TL-2023]
MPVLRSHSESRPARFPTILVFFSDLGKPITTRWPSGRCNTFSLCARPVLTCSSLKEARALGEDQPVQHISFLLALGIDDDLDVARLRKVRKFILKP